MNKRKNIFIAFSFILGLALAGCQNPFLQPNEDSLGNDGNALSSYSPPSIYTVSFNSVRGSSVADIGGVTSGSAIEGPGDPVKAHFDFLGWYKDAKYANQWNFSTDTVNADITLYAKWGFDGNQGDGSPMDPFLVYDVPTLEMVGKNSVWDLSEHYKQIDDIFMEEAGNWAPIGSVVSDRFSGTYNGGGFAIFNLSCYGSSDYGTGLFSSLDEGAVVENVGLVNAYIKGDSYVGGIAGENFGIIQNCFFKGEGYAEGDMPVTNVEMLGGITGRNCGTVERCYAVGTLTGVNYVGGIVGENENSFSTNPAIKDCYSAVVCTGIGGIATGGIAGNVCGYSLIQNCYALGNINGSTCAAGIVGEYYDDFEYGIMQNCVALNKKIIASNIDVARVAAGPVYDNGDPTISNVYARSDMVLEGLVEPIVVDGVGIAAKAQYNNESWWANPGTWPGTAGWDFDDVWEWDDVMQLPVLQNVGGQ